MTAYYQDELVTIYNADCRAALACLDENSISSCVTDPPYELGFMNKHWDSSGIAYDVEMWKEVYRVLKPGAHLLAFSSTRTYHRMACAIEDAGFTVRDTLHWTFASGFPKNLDVSKQLDRMAGVEREVIGKRVYGDGHIQNSTKLEPPIGTFKRTQDERAESLPATDAARQWQGWGTALKPAHEILVLATKELNTVPIESIIAFETKRLLEVLLCQLLNAKYAEALLESSQQEQRGEFDFVHKAVVSAITRESVELSAKTAMFKSPEAGEAFLSIVWLWNYIWGENSHGASRFTTLTRINLITELRTLNSLILASIYQSITHLPESKAGGLIAFAKNAENFSKDENAKLSNTLKHSAPADALMPIVIGVLRALVGTAEKFSSTSIPESSIAQQPATDMPGLGLAESESRRFASIVVRCLKRYKVETQSIAIELAWQKPTVRHELICLARKPLSESSIAANVLKWGTGALNIDASRIKGQPIKTKNGTALGILSDDSWDNTKRKGSEWNSDPQGRWPANVILSHDPNCERVGEKHIKGIGGGATAQTSIGGNGAYSGGKSRTLKRPLDTDGFETVPVYSCVEGCPVAELDRQSGNLHSAGSQQERQSKWNSERTPGWGNIGTGPSGARFGDSGSASRFYFTAEWSDEDDLSFLVPFYYQAKASRAERCKGLEDAPRRLKLRDDLSDEQKEYVIAELRKAGVSL